MHTYKTNLFYFTTLLIILLSGSCKQTVYSGSYCAKVNYHNAKTGTSSEYTLNVSIENNILKEIKFPSGYLNQDHFGLVKVNQDGKAVVEIEGNLEYKVKITGDIENCMNNVAKAVQCTGISSTGRRCKNFTDNPGGLCHHHINQ